MKGSILVCGILCVLLSGCQDTAGAQPPLEEPSSECTTEVDVSQEKLTYYEELVKNLQGQLLDLKASLFSERVEHGERIEALEQALNAMKQDEPSGEGDNITDGLEPDAEQSFRFFVANGEATLTAYLGSERTLTIPPTLGGCPVVAIADRAFLNKTALTSLTLPETVREIGWFAFSGCVALESVELPSSVSTIAYGAFQNCSDRLTVVCWSGSYAEAYAQSYGMRILRK